MALIQYLIRKNGRENYWRGGYDYGSMKIKRTYFNADQKELSKDNFKKKLSKLEKNNSKLIISKTEKSICNDIKKIKNVYKNIGIKLYIINS